MANPTTPVLYYRTDTTKSDDINDLPDAQKIVFESNDVQIISIDGGGTGNIITEPEYSPSGEKTYNKQESGGFTENHTIIANIKISSGVSKKLRSFFRKQQLDFTDFPFGIFGFFHNSDDYWNVNPTSIVGYTIDPPRVILGDNVEYHAVTIILVLGGKNLT